MIIRKARLDDLEELFQIGTQCFFGDEALSKDKLKARLETYPENFWLLEIENKIVAFIVGLTTDKNFIEDTMFDDVAEHNKSGKWQTILGVNTLPEYRKKGYANILMKALIEESKNRGNLGCILTCKESLVPYYEKFGYISEGVSNSKLAEKIWYDMRLTF